MIENDDDDKISQKKRNQQMLKLYMRGRSIEEIAQEFNLSSSRVYEIAEKHRWKRLREYQDREYTREIAREIAKEIKAEAGLNIDGVLREPGPNGRYYRQIRVILPKIPEGGKKRMRWGAIARDPKKSECVPVEDPDSNDFWDRVFLTDYEVVFLKKSGLK